MDKAYKSTVQKHRHADVKQQMCQSKIQVYDAERYKKDQENQYSL
jgi:hypothetical protein